LYGEEHPQLADVYNKLATNLNAQRKYAEAEDYWVRAGQAFELARLRSNRTGLERASYAAATGNSPLSSLTGCLARNGKSLAAWQVLESSLARGLLDEWSARLPRPMNKEEDRQEKELLAKLDQLDRQVLEFFTSKRDDKSESKRLQEFVEQRRQTGKEL